MELIDQQNAFRENRRVLQHFGWRIHKDGKGHTWFCSEETNHRRREFPLFAVLSSDICDGNMLDATWECSRALCYIGGCLFPGGYSCETCARPIFASHMIVCFDAAARRTWQLCMPCFDDEYGIDVANAPSTNLFLHKVDSVPGSAAVSGDDFIREGQIGSEEIMRGSRCQRPIRWRCTRCDKQLCRMHTVFRGPYADPFCVQCVRNMSNADRVTYNRGNGPDDDHDFHHACGAMASTLMCAKPFLGLVVGPPRMIRQNGGCEYTRPGSDESPAALTKIALFQSRCKRQQTGQGPAGFSVPQPTCLGSGILAKKENP